MGVFTIRSLTALALTLGAGVAHADLFSPGDLAKPHHALEGISNCTKCHPAGGQLSPEKCLDCHDELQPRFGRGKGFHGLLPANQKSTCEGCHHEHQGEDFALIDWGSKGKKEFEHTKAGWPLKGKHARVECQKCHDKRLVEGERFAKLFSKRDTYLGSLTTCQGCHFDEHRGQVETTCESCHDEKGWSPAPGFDHGKTKYKLEGKHKKVLCADCHPKVSDEGSAAKFPPPRAETYLKYAPLPFRACTDCHKDPHENRFGPRCQTCHTVDGWTTIRNLKAERDFHDKTRYPLQGEHIEVACTSCHGPWPGQPAKFKAMQFGKCTDCHVDAHEGQLAPTKGRSGPLCEDCHSVDGFMPPKYDLLKHAKTLFPLEGAHQVSSCRGCHGLQKDLVKKVPASVTARLKRQKRPLLLSFAVLDVPKKPEQCIACHRDVHAAQFPKGSCSTCHTLTSFADLKFDHQKDSKYPLEGAHAKVACDACHGADAKGVVRYKPLETTCAGCHADVHVGQFGKKGQASAACERCHDTVKFKPASKFAHAPPFTNYLLDGAHATLTCVSCHAESVLASGTKVARYKPLPLTCEGCHADFHRGAFKGFSP